MASTLNAPNNGLHCTSIRQTPILDCLYFYAIISSLIQQSDVNGLKTVQFSVISSVCVFFCELHSNYTIRYHQLLNGEHNNTINHPLQVLTQVLDLVRHFGSFVDIANRLRLFCLSVSVFILLHLSFLLLLLLFFLQYILSSLTLTNQYKICTRKHLITLLGSSSIHLQLMCSSATAIPRRHTDARWVFEYI